MTTQATVADGRTNRLAVTKEQLTGLSDALTSRSLSFVNGYKTTSSETSFNRETLEQTESVWSATSGTVVRKSKFGRVTEEVTEEGSTYNFFEAFGRVFYTERTDPASTTRLSSTWTGYNHFGDVIEKDVFHASVVIG